MGGRVGARQEPQNYWGPVAPASTAPVYNFIFVHFELDSGAKFTLKRSLPNTTTYSFYY